MTITSKKIPTPFYSSTGLGQNQNLSNQDGLGTWDEDMTH